MALNRRCRNPHCNRLFAPRPNIKNQQYCSDKACQAARKREWQRRKMAEDPAYRENQESARQGRREQNPDYFRQYRASHPEYTKRNREQQKERDNKRKEASCKLDASADDTPFKSGIYRIIKLDSGSCKLDALNDLFYIIPDGSCGSCKKDLIDFGIF